MTKKEMKRFKKQKEMMFNETEKFYSDFAKMNGFKLTNFAQIEDDIFGDGVPRCICVYSNN